MSENVEFLKDFCIFDCFGRIGCNYESNHQKSRKHKHCAQNEGRKYGEMLKIGCVLLGILDTFFAREYNIGMCFECVR